MTRIYYAADSIVAQKNIFTYPETGIGQMLPLYLKRTVYIQNHAENGRSTKSFIDESNKLVFILLTNHQPRRMSFRASAHTGVGIRIP